MTPELWPRVKKAGTSLVIRLLKPFYSIGLIRRIYWEVYAPEIDRAWGNERDDFSTISGVLDRFRPSKVLDVGCGSGRLFGVYTDHKIPSILGVDISEKALSIANRKYPGIPTLRLSVEEIAFGKGSFDLVICNRTLQHIPPEKIPDVIRRLCSCTKRVYLNETTPADGGKCDRGLFSHDYAAYFGEQQFHAECAGEIPKKTGERQFYTVFSKNTSE